MGIGPSTKETSLHHFRDPLLDVVSSDTDLDLMGIMVSTGSACDSKNTQVSHVLRAIRAHMDYAVGTIRISLGKNNTKEDAEKIAGALIKIVVTVKPNRV